MTLVKKFNRFALTAIASLLLTSTAFATAVQFGVTLPILLKSKDPEGVHGYRAVLWYQPQSLIWGNLNLYFAGGVGHWWAHGAKNNRVINIYAIAPVLRYYFKKSPHFSPYVEASIGPAYMNRTKFSNRNLGIHYTFQDEIGIGALFGVDQGFYASLSALHYSNGHLSQHNSGITVPLILNVGYKFS
jgi:lipid A 3-O-deacylase